MHSLTLFVTLALLLGLVYAKPSIDFTANVTLHVGGNGNQHRDFSFRRIVNVDWVFARGFISTNVSADSDSIERQTIIALSSTGLLLNSRPIFVLASINKSLSTENAWDNAKFSESANMIGGVYGKINEVDPQGNVVVSLDLKDVNWGHLDVDANNDDIKVVSYVGQSGTTANISIHFLTSQVVGRINLANTVLTPRSLESVIEIDNWPYANSANHLELTMYAISADLELDGALTFKHGSDEAQVYYSVGGSVTTSAGTKSVEVKGWTQCSLGDLRLPVIFEGFFKARYGVSFKTYSNVIQFPAGAEQIQYDPAVGQGPTYETPNSALSLLPSFLLVALVLIAFI